jgi:hypothetical protein
MKQKSSTFPLIAGFLLIVGSFLGLAGVSLMALDSSTDEETAQQEQQKQAGETDFSSDFVGEETERLIVPIQTEGASGADATSSSQTGIPTGTYSNPPTSISSPSSSSYSSTSPLETDNSSNTSGLSSQSLNTSSPSTSSFSSFSSSTSSSSSESLLDSSSFDAGIESSSSSSSFSPNSSRDDRSSGDLLGF